MANRPADAGSGRGLAPTSSAAPPLNPVAPPPPDRVAPPPPDRVAPPPPDRVAPPPPVHHDAPPRAEAPRAEAPRADAPRTAAGHRAARSRESRPARDRNVPGASGLAWVPYLIVLAGAATGMFVVWQGSRYVGRGTALVGGSLLAAGLARLIVPPRYASLLSTRRKASDVLAFAVLGAAVVAVSLMLP